jgi:hypothetical protein
MEWARIAAIARAVAFSSFLTRSSAGALGFREHQANAAAAGKNYGRYSLFIDELILTVRVNGHGIFVVIFDRPYQFHFTYQMDHYDIVVVLCLFKECIL